MCPCVDRGLGTTQGGAAFSDVEDERGDKDQGDGALNTSSDGAAVTMPDDDGATLARVDGALCGRNVGGERSPMQGGDVDVHVSLFEFAHKRLHVGGLVVEAVEQHHVGPFHAHQSNTGVKSEASPAALMYERARRLPGIGNVPETDAAPRRQPRFSAEPRGSGDRHTDIMCIIGNSRA